MISTTPEHAAATSARSDGGGLTVCHVFAGDLSLRTVIGERAAVSAHSRLTAAAYRGLYERCATRATRRGNAAR